LILINELMDGDKEPEALKTVLTMYDTLGFTHQGVADILNITKENSKSGGTLQGRR
jgi:hypothetical protein